MGLIFMELCIPATETFTEKYRVFNKVKNGEFPADLCGYKLELTKQMSNMDAALRPDCKMIKQEMSRFFQMSQHTEKPEYRFNINYGINNATNVKTGDISKEGYNLDTNSMPRPADWPTLDDRQRPLIDRVLGHNR